MAETLVRVSHRSTRQLLLYTAHCLFLRRSTTTLNAYGTSHTAQALVCVSLSNTQYIVCVNGVGSSSSTVNGRQAWQRQRDPSRFSVSGPRNIRRVGWLLEVWPVATLMRRWHITDTYYYYITRDQNFKHNCASPHQPASHRLIISESRN